MKTMRSILLASVAAASVAMIPVACTSYSSDSPTAGTSGSSSSSSAAGSSGSSSSASSGGSGGSSSDSGGGGGGSTQADTNVPDPEPFTGIPLPCDVIGKDEGGAKCVSAHSTIRVIVGGYSGPLYQLCKGSSSPGPSSCKGETKDIMAIDGYADVQSHEDFCGTESCTFTKLYDQSGNGNDLEPAPQGRRQGYSR